MSKTSVEKNQKVHFKQADGTLACGKWEFRKVTTDPVKVSCAFCKRRIENKNAK